MGEQTEPTWCQCGNRYGLTYHDLELDELLALGRLYDGEPCPTSWNDEIVACPNCGTWRER